MATGGVLEKNEQDDNNENQGNINSLDLNGKIKPLIKNGRYENPWKTWTSNHFTVKNFIKFRWQKQPNNLPNDEELDRTLQVVKPDFSEFSSSSPVMHCSWLGHATMLVHFDGVTVLTDPLFSTHCSPLKILGPKRYRPPPCTVSELPPIDAVIISHNHYDHLDLKSVLDLNRRFGKQLKWYVPVGLKKWLVDTGCENSSEMTWWEEQLLSEKMNVRLVCLPCQHWSRRSVSDTNTTLWCSWAVIGPRNRFYFAGDTGYCDVFTQIGKHFGPFSLAAIPIGNYKPSWFLSPQHASPSEAVQIHHDLQSRTSIGIHWGTFSMMSYEHYLEPKQDLEKALLNTDMKGSSFICLKHGEVRTFGS